MVAASFIINSGRRAKLIQAHEEFLEREWTFPRDLEDVFVFIGTVMR